MSGLGLGFGLGTGLGSGFDYFHPFAICVAPFALRRIQKAHMAQRKWRNGESNRTLTLTISLTLIITLTLTLTLFLTLNLTDYFRRCAICVAPFALRRTESPAAAASCSYNLEQLWQCALGTRPLRVH